MKISAKQLSGFLAKPDQVNACLLFGPDQGMVREHAKTIIAAIATDATSDFASTSLEAGQVKDDPAMLHEALAATTLMGDRPVAVIRQAGDNLTAMIDKALAEDRGQNYLILCAGELAARSSLRKLFESSKHMAAIGCYKDEGFALEKTLRAGLDARNIRCDRDTLRYMTDILGNDRGVTMQELEKIDLYLGDERQLTLEALQALVPQNDDKGMDDLCLAVVGGNSARTNQLIERLLSEGSSPIALLRAVSRHIQRLLTAHGHMASGSSAEDAMKKLRPPVFFKQAPAFQQHLRRLSAVKLRKAQALLFMAERDAKGRMDPALTCLRSLTRLTHLCR